VVVVYGLKSLLECLLELTDSGLSSSFRNTNWGDGAGGGGAEEVLFNNLFFLKHEEMCCSRKTVSGTWHIKNVKLWLLKK